MSYTLKPGTTLHGNTYRILRFLSSGGFGCTYEAEHILLGSRVAVKELFVRDFCLRDEATGAVSVASREREPLVERIRSKFIEEARVLYGFKHPGIVNVSDLFEENGTAYYIMDFIDGRSLADIVSQRGALPEDEAVGYIRQAAEALRYVHSKTRLHLDIKPANIMINPAGKAILIDFGVSKQYDEVNGQNTSTLMGVTPNYAPPEQMANDVKLFLKATDIYALGATLYTLLTGQLPTPGMKRLFGETLDPLPPGISETTRKAVEHAMTLDRNTRTPDTETFLSELADPAEPAKPAEENETKQFSDTNAAKPSTTIPASGPIVSWPSTAIPPSPSTSSGKATEKATCPADTGDIELRIFRGNNGKWGFCDKAFREVIPCIYEDADSFSEGLARVRKSGKWGFINKTGREVIPCIYEHAFSFSEGLASVRKSGKWGFIDKSGREVIPCLYDHVYSFSEGLAAVRISDKWGFINKFGREVIPCLYDHVYSFSEGLAIVKKSNKYGYVIKSGKEVIPCKYIEAENFHAGKAKVRLYKWGGIIDKAGYIDKTGKWI